MTGSGVRVCILGLGYIGLPTASLLAARGMQVLGVDIRPEVVESVNLGRMHIKEPELGSIVREAVESGKLRAALEPAPADVFIIAVPTPFKEGHKPDLSMVEAATASIAPYLEPTALVILESTSPVGATEGIASRIRALRPGLEVGGPRGVKVAHCPERVLPGRIVHELIENDRIVGGIDEASTRAAEAFYRGFVNGRVLTTNARTAELAKLTENAFRDVNIAFANELSLISDRLDIDVRELIALANCHPRVNVLQPGPGVGGHCIAVDPWFIVDSAPEASPLIRTARLVNDGKPRHVVEKARAAAAKFPRPRIACLGLTYKPDIDDTRESPALRIAGLLAEDGRFEVLAADPNLPACPPPLRESPKVRFLDVREAVAEADVVLLLVAHQEFRELSKDLFEGKVIIDTCGAWSEPVAERPPEAR